MPLLAVHDVVQIYNSSGCRADKSLSDCDCCIANCAGGPPENAYMWAEFEPPVEECSVVRSVGDSFVDNQAAVAGGAVYATDMASLNMTCSSGLPRDNVTGCPAWTGNTVLSSPTVLG